MKQSTLRHRTNKKMFLHIINDGRGNPAYRLRIVESTVPQLVPGKGKLSAVLSFYQQPGWMSPENIIFVRDNYDYILVELTFSE